MKKSTNLTTGTQGTAVETAVRSEYSLTAVPKLTVDWNLNRYTIPTVDNTPSEDDEGFDIELFPIDSIIEPIRPSKGLLKARVGEAVVSSGYKHPNDPKFYVGDENDVYKYWTSPYQTDGSGVFPTHTDSITTVRPTVSYPAPMKTNKIMIKVDNTWATPDSYNVLIKTTPGGTFSIIGGSSPAIDVATGIITLYFNGTAWVTTRPANLVSTNVAGIQFRVVSMKEGYDSDGNIMTYRKARTVHGTSDYGTLDDYDTDGSNSSLSLIAIEAHLEADFTDRLMTVETDFEMSDTSQLYPIGTLTTNTGSVVLSNEDGVLDVENSSSPYYGILAPNAEFNLQYIYTIDGVEHSVQEFKMYCGEWVDSDGTVSMDLEDASKFLKTTKPRQIMIEGRPVTEIIWRVLDSVGFNDYAVQSSDLVKEHIIPVFWTTGDDTVWEVLDSLAQASQTAIYFDSYGMLQVRTRNAAFRDTADADWTLLGQNNGTDLADIISLDSDGDYEANKIAVKYKTTKWKVGPTGKPALSRIWEPDSDVAVLRSSPLIRNIIDTSNFIFLDQKDIKIWPYKSKVQIDGEVIQYDGKQYIYYTSGFSNDSVVINSYEEKLKYDKLTPRDHRSKNHFTGGLKITEREVWNSDQRDHSVDASNWAASLELQTKTAGVSGPSPKGFRYNRRDSTVTINTPNNMKNADDTFWATRGDAGATGYNAYGTRLAFTKDNASTTQRAGIGFQLSGTRNAGYYVEICLTNSLSAKERQSRNEVSIYSRVNGNWNRLSKGTPIAIAQNIWYEVDVYVAQVGDQQRIAVWVNGQKVAEGTTDSSTKQAGSGKVCMYARGRSNVSYEYFYAVARSVTEPRDDYGFFDLKYGGIRGDQWQREYVWDTRTRWKKIKKKKWKKETYKHNQYLFDEFGPYVHEVREYDVKFDPAPVRYSYLFSTNEWYSATLEYTGNPFGAEFVVANSGRNNAVIKGDDSLLYGGTDRAVTQVFTVLGQNLEISDEEAIRKRNDESIRARGPIDSELSSDWIQSKTMAEDIAIWMAQHWSEGVDQIKLDIFGNPLLEICDVVAVDYDLKHMGPVTHKYFVVGVSNSFDQGISTSVTLRRIRTADPDNIR